MRRPARVLAGICLLAALALLAAGDTRSQDQDRKDGGPVRPAAKGQLPKYWGQLGLTDAQRAEVLKVTADHQEKKAKLQEEIRKLDEEVARKRVALLTDEQRKKLIDLVAGPDPKAKADPKAKGKDK
jgi:hypothetical protein